MVEILHKLTVSTPYKHGRLPDIGSQVSDRQKESLSNRVKGGNNRVTKRQKDRLSD